MNNNKMPNKDSHSLHKKIGNRFQYIDFPNCNIVKSSECGGAQKIPLFCSKVTKKNTKYCEVDLLFIKNNKIKVILEIEESSIMPIKIFGKFLASTLSSIYFYENSSHEMDNSVVFIQIVGTKIKDKSSKREQVTNIKNSIQKIIPVQGSKIERYELIFEYLSDFDEEKLTEIFDLIQEVLK